jgi:hypothetical protein
VRRVRRVDWWFPPEYCPLGEVRWIDSLSGQGADNIVAVLSPGGALAASLRLVAKENSPPALLVRVTVAILLRSGIALARNPGGRPL